MLPSSNPKMEDAAKSFESKVPDDDVKSNSVMEVIDPQNEVKIAGSQNEVIEIVDGVIEITNPQEKEKEDEEGDEVSDSWEETSSDFDSKEENQWMKHGFYALIAVVIVMIIYGLVSGCRTKVKSNDELKSFNKSAEVDEDGEIFKLREEVVEEEKESHKKHEKENPKNVKFEEQSFTKEEKDADNMLKKEEGKEIFVDKLEIKTDEEKELMDKQNQGYVEKTSKKGKEELVNSEIKEDGDNEIVNKEIKIIEEDKKKQPKEAIDEKKIEKAINDIIDEYKKRNTCECCCSNNNKGDKKKQRFIPNLVEAELPITCCNPIFCPLYLDCFKEKTIQKQFDEQLKKEIDGIHDLREVSDKGKNLEEIKKEVKKKKEYTSKRCRRQWSRYGFSMAVYIFVAAVFMLIMYFAEHTNQLKKDKRRCENEGKCICKYITIVLFIIGVIILFFASSGVFL